MNPRRARFSRFATNFVSKLLFNRISFFTSQITDSARGCVIRTRSRNSTPQTNRPLADFRLRIQRSSADSDGGRDPDFSREKSGSRTSKTKLPSRSPRSDVPSSRVSRRKRGRVSSMRQRARRPRAGEAAQCPRRSGGGNF